MSIQPNATHKTPNQLQPGNLDAARLWISPAHFRRWSGDHLRDAEGDSTSKCGSSRNPKSQSLPPFSMTMAADLHINFALYPIPSALRSSSSALARAWSVGNV
jgi:hypothetical protein